MMVHFLVTDGYGKYTTTSEDDEADSFWVLTKEVRGVHNVRENCANALEYANKSLAKETEGCQVEEWIAHHGSHEYCNPLTFPLLPLISLPLSLS